MNDIWHGASAMVQLLYIYHGFYELIYLYQRIRWVGLNKFMSKIHGIYDL